MKDKTHKKNFTGRVIITISLILQLDDAHSINWMVKQET